MGDLHANWVAAREALDEFETSGIQPKPVAEYMRLWSAERDAHEALVDAQVAAARSEPAEEI